MKRRRPTIGDNPLDMLLPRTTPAVARAARQARSTPAPAAESRPRSKQRFTVHLPADVIDAVKNAAIALSGPPMRLTLAQIAEDAFRREVDRLQKQHNGGKPFPARASNSVGGRPIRS